MKPRNFACLLFLGIAWASLPAQGPVPLFGSAGKAQIPLPRAVRFHDCVLLDFDGDGAVDIAAAGKTLLLYRNTGKAIFADQTASRVPALKMEPSNLAAGDLDGDGAPDLAVSAEGRLVLMKNDGKGRFKDVSSSSLPSLAWIPGGFLLAADVDGDKDLDLLLGGEIGREWKSLLLLNDGRGRFQAGQGGKWTSSTHPWKALPGDVDGDGDMDLLAWVPKPALQPILFLNDGKGRFSPDRSNRIPRAVIQVEDAVLGDMDGDGDLDLFLGTNTGYLLYENKGKGFFKDTGGAGLPPRSAPVSALLFSDLDGDGRPDLLAGGAWESLSLRRNRLYRNLGGGKFMEIPAGDLGTSLQFTRKFLSADLDGDKDRDLVVLDDRGLELLLNDGNGWFTAAVTGPCPRYRGDTRDFLLADLDGDGFLDLYLGNSGRSAFLSDPDQVFLGTGTGGFRDPGPGRTAVLPGVASQSLAAGDVDGDGDLDIATGTNGKARLFLNSGKAYFQDGSQGRLPPDTYGMVVKGLADLDGDGDPDLLVDRYFGGKDTPVLFNDGKGNFRPAPSRIPIQWFSLVGWGDTDGDGDPDLLMGGLDTSTPKTSFRVFQFVNDGKGNFKNDLTREIPSSGTNFFSTSLFQGLYDLDGDGDLDLLACDRKNLFSWVNDGKGRFTLKVPQPGAPCERVLLVADLTGEGKVQVLGVSGGKPVLYRGGPSFKADLRWTFPEEWALSWKGIFRLKAADLDGDGDLDVAAAGRDRFHYFYFNRLRQVFSPNLLRPGGKWRLEFHALGPAKTVLPMLSPFRGKLQAPPFGLFQLGPSRLFLLPPFTLPPGGVTAGEYPIPRNPALLGGQVFFQALFADPLFLPGSRLSNLLAETIVP